MFFSQRLKMDQIELRLRLSQCRQLICPYIRLLNYQHNLAQISSFGRLSTQLHLGIPITLLLIFVAAIDFAPRILIKCEIINIF